jgi:hypothetical protein
MTEEYGGVHTIERRSGIERRASNWRDATDQQHEARRRQYVALLAALDALAVHMQQADPQRYDVRDGANWLAAEVQKHRDAR